MKSYLAIFVILASIVGESVCIGQTTQSAKIDKSAEHFIRAVIKMVNARPESAQWEALDGSDRIYSPSLMSAIEPTSTTIVDHLMWARVCGCRFDRNDHVPLCGDCRGIKLSNASTKMTSEETVDVTFRNHDDELTWHLLKTSKGWRIDDVSTADFPSLNAYLMKKAGMK